MVKHLHKKKDQEQAIDVDKLAASLLKTTIEISKVVKVKYFEDNI